MALPRPLTNTPAGLLSQMAPQSGVLRLCVDGTSGNNANTGIMPTTPDVPGAWANAWKTLAYAQAAIEQILIANPDNLRVDLYHRGAFSNETFILTGTLAGSTTVNFIHPVSEWTVEKTGTMTSVATTATACALKEFTLAGIALVSGDVGKWLFIEDGAGKRWPTQILRVVSGTVALTGATAVPTWISGAAPGALTVKTRVMSVTGILAVQTMLATPFLNYISSMLVTACASWSDAGSQGLTALLQSVGGSCYLGGMRVSMVGITSFFVSTAALVDYGFLGTNTADSFYLGSRHTGTYNPTFDGTVDVNFVGLMGTNSLHGGARNVGLSVNRSAILGTGNLVSTLQLLIINSICNGQVSVSRDCYLDISKFSYLDVPAAGVSGGLLYIQRGGRCSSASTIDGINDGTGTQLYGIKVDKGGFLEADDYSGFGYPATLTGKHGNLHVESGGSVEIAADVSFGASLGGGPDVYFGPDSQIALGGNFTKSAVNSSVASQSGADGQITAASNRFTSATAAFTSAHVGRSIKISGAVNPANNNVFLITAFVGVNDVTLEAGPAYVNEGPGLTWGLVGTPAPIIEAAVGAKITQTAGKTFTVKCPELGAVSGLQEWYRYGYGSLGWANVHAGSNVVLGTLAETGGLATATGTAATVKNGSSLLHAGGAVILGVAPLDLGGLPAPIPWPAAAQTDQGAVTPQGCLVIPGVT